MLGDALCELGDYDEAARAYERMEALGKDDLGTLTRLARFDYLHGRVESAQERLLAALWTASARMQPPRETLAWIRWQLGELAFSVGDYRDSRVVVPVRPGDPSHACRPARIAGQASGRRRPNGASASQPPL